MTHNEQMSKRKRHITIIRRSCLTGKAMWIYQGTSHEAAKKLYWKACKREIHRVRYLWGLMVARRGKNIARLLTSCTERMPLTAELTPEQKEAARQLQHLAKRVISCDRDFYEHIVCEWKHRNDSSRRWRKNRQKWLGDKKL